MSSLALRIHEAPTFRRLSGFARMPALALAVAVVLVAWPLLVATRHGAPRPPLSPARAELAVKRDPAAGPALAKLTWTRLDVTPIDHSEEALWFEAGPRVVLSAVVAASGSVVDYSTSAHGGLVHGSNIANDPRVLFLLCLVFVMMSAVWPLWRIRNLDVAVVASLTFAVVLFNAATFGRMVLAAYPALSYLAFRCACFALLPRRSPRPSVPLYEHATRRWSAREQLRLLRMIAGACALVVVMVGLSSLRVVDVGYAVMQGATAILHGLSPYGHIAGIVHGDTYPIGSYLAYVPFAWLTPVRDQFDSADATLAVAVAAALMVAWMIARAARRIDHGPDRSEQPARTLTGLRSAIMWMTFPPLLVTISTGSSDLLLAAVLVAALLLWRRPTISTTVLAAGGWFKLAPVALLPLWLAPLRKAPLLKASAAVAALSAAVLGALAALGGWPGVLTMVHAVSYQATRLDPYSAWGRVGSVPFQQLAEAATLALIVGSAARLRRDPDLARDPLRRAALAGAVLLGLQLCGGYWTYMYVVWVMPFLALSVLAP